MQFEQLPLRLQGDIVSTADILQFEEEIGGLLDDDYRRFLLHSNGGVLSGRVESSLAGLKYPILNFFSLEREYKGLRRVFETVLELYQENTESRYLPIASDSGNRWIALEIGVKNSEVFLISEEPFAINSIATSFGEFMNSLSQFPESKPSLEELAEKSWSEIREYIERGGSVSGKDGELSLLAQTIRCNNFEAFERLLDTKFDMSEAIEVAVLNRRLDMLKLLIEKGGDPLEALDFAVGPDRLKIREYLQSVS